jgi:DNA invertase Pin-like site-specific DNA recombinase
MSTDHQQYSLDNQADAIARYAVLNRFRIVKTYSDAARSGLRLKNRPGLKQLLKDVMEGQVEFRAVLVYDVSRWGRFQDTDEAAHYEYLCKSSGVPVHYCAEMFSNDNSVSDLILKALKRTMAGEYSRELSVKVKTGLVRLAKLGYMLGGSAPYGLRRQLLDVQGRPKQLLKFGDRKSLANEHVIFVPGSAEETAIIQRIFREFADERHSVNLIADCLNQEGIPYLRGAIWKGNTLRILLQDPRYIGMQVWGRTTQFLSSPVKRLPVSQWVIYPNAFEPIISQDLFLRAQEVFANFTIRLSDEQLLERLGRLLKEQGELSSRIIDNSRLCPGATAYIRRFGGLLALYTRLGYNTPGRRAYISLRQRGALLRRSLITSLIDAFPNQIQEVRRNKRFRPLLRYRGTGLLISVVFARCCTGSLGRSWIIEIPTFERRRTTLLALLDFSSNAIESLRVFSGIPTKDRHMRVREGDDWLRSGVPLERISDLLDAVRAVRSAKDDEKTASDAGISTPPQRRPM